MARIKTTIKSTMQINYEKAKLVISAIIDTVSNPENYQMYIVKEFYKAFHKNNLELAYDIINEAFNQCHIAGYKYLECCDLCNVKGEFREIAQANPLCNL